MYEGKDKIQRKFTKILTMVLALFLFFSNILFIYGLKFSIMNINYLCSKKKATKLKSIFPPNYVHIGFFVL